MSKTVRHINTLLYYDGLVLFHAQDSYGGHYLCMAVCMTILCGTLRGGLNLYRIRLDSAGCSGGPWEIRGGWQGRSSHHDLFHVCAVRQFGDGGQFDLLCGLHGSLLMPISHALNGGF